MSTDTQCLLGCVVSAIAAWAIVDAIFNGGYPLRKLIVRKKAKQAFAQRPRARVLRAGDIITRPDGRQITVGFIFDCRDIIPGYSRGPDGEYLITGYTSDELFEIARRPSEFVESEE